MSEEHDKAVEKPRTREIGWEVAVAYCWLGLTYFARMIAQRDVVGVCIYLLLFVYGARRLLLGPDAFTSSTS